MKKTFTAFLLFFITQGFAQGFLIPPTSIDSTNGSTAPDMVVYDHLGNSYYLNQLRIQNSNYNKPSTISPTCNAGIFRLHFTDAGTGLGFDDPTLGPQRQAVACQVYSDLSQLIVPANSPYSSIPNLGTTSFVEIWVQASLNNSSNPTLGQAGQFFLTSSQGIVHGSVWQTINTGIDSWFGVNSTNLGTMGIFHGVMQINFGHPFYLGTNPAGISATNFDLYTVILHEATHALGFGSLISQNGNSKLTASNPGIYSYYDTFLKDNATGQNLINSSSCYSPVFNNAFLSDLTTPCTVRFSGTNSTFVSSSSTWANGTSLSHYDIGACTNTGSYVMNPSLNPGVTRRVLDIAEVTTLCDLGYTTSGTLGSTSYPSNGICGFRVAGANDFASYTSTAPGTNFSTPFNTPFNFSSTTILDNDQNALFYDCLSIVNGSGSLSGSLSGGTGNNITFTPNTGFQGVAILKYIPRASATGQKGNITYIFILVNPPALPPCNAATCEMICYGGLEEFTSQLQYDLYTLGSFSAGFANCFSFYTGSPPDNSPDFRNVTMGFPMYNSCPGTFSPISAHTGIAYVGLILRTDAAGNNLPEGPSLPLNTPLNPGETATISMWARLNNSSCQGGVEIRFTNNQPCGGNTFLGSCAGLIQSPVLSSGSLTSPTNVWQQITLTYFNNTTTTFNFLLINSLPFATTNSPIYIDDISCVKNTPNLTITKTGPASACPGDIVPYSITVCNNSGFTASNVNITDNLPTGMSLSSGGNFTYPTQNISALASGACVTYNLNAQVNATFGSLVNTVNVSSGGCLVNNNTNSTTLNISSQSLNVITTPSSSNPCAGSIINISVDVCNYGSNPINNISIQTQLPAGYIASSGSGYTISGQNINFNLFNLLGGTATSPACTTLVVPVTVGNVSGAICTTVLSGGNTCINQSTGCTNINISICNPCTYCPNILAASGVLSTNPAPNQVYCVYNDFDVVGNITMSLSEVKIFKNAKITVKPGSTLNIVGSHLYSCEEMWQGIVVQKNARINMIASIAGSSNVSTLIEDAIIAVDIEGGNSLTTNILTSDNVTFNRNQIGINISLYDQTINNYPFSVINTVFTCRDIPFVINSIAWPQNSTVKANTNPITSQLQTPYINNNVFSQTNSNAYLKVPFAGQKSQTGIYLFIVGNSINVQTTNPTYYEIVIGAAGASKYNVFDNQVEGLSGFHSNVKLINNIFQNTITYGKGGSFGSIGVHVQSRDGFNTRLQIVAGNLSGNFNNKFFNCSSAIISQNYFENHINYADIRSTQAYSPVTFLNHVGLRGVYISTNRFRMVNVNNNKIYNIENGISFNGNQSFFNINNTYIGNGQYSGHVTINGNTIRQNWPTEAVTSQYVANAITVNNVIPTGDYQLVPFSKVNVNNNTIVGTFRGISTLNWQKKDILTNNNTIILIPQTSLFGAPPTQFGISHSNDAPNTVNTTYGNQITGFGLTNPNISGIYSSMTNNHNVRCNTTTNTYKGLVFDGNCSPSSTSYNMVSNHHYGFVLDHNGLIGQQGNSTVPCDNQYNGTWSSHFKTATLNGSSAQNSKMYVRSSGFNANPNGSSFSSMGASGAYDISNSSLIYVSGTPQFIGCSTNPNNPPNLAISKKPLEDVVQDQIIITENPVETDYINKHQVYKTLKANPDLMTGSTILQDFYTNSQSTNRYAFTSIEDDFSAGDLSSANGKIASIAPQNNIELNYKEFYQLYAHVSTDSIITVADSTQLANIASACPFTTGAVVYQARALFNIVYRSNVQFEDNCPTEQASSRMANNSITNVQEIINDANIFDALIYPNPSTGQIFVSPVNFKDETINLIVSDVTGKIIFDSQLIISNGIADFKLDEKSGVYVIKLINPVSKEQVIKRIVIQK